MDIRKTDKKIHDNFTEAEFFCKSADYTDEVTVMDDNVVNAIFTIRDHFKIDKTSEKDGIIINSTLRSKLGNELAGGVSTSKHLKGQAIDFKFCDEKNHQKFYSEIANGGALFLKLRKAGINAFGIYDTFFHIDSADYSKQNTSGRDHLGKFKVWDETSKKKNLLR